MAFVAAQRGDSAPGITFRGVGRGRCPDLDLIASVVSFFVSFGLQRLWTFRSTEPKAALPQLMAFVALFLTNSAINAGLLYVMVEDFHAPYLLSELLIAVLIAMWNFFIMRFLIFR